MASSILIANWVFLGERSESGADGVTARDDNSRLNQHLHNPKASSTTRQVVPIFLLFLPASFQTACWAEDLCWQISLNPYVTPEVLGGEDAHGFCAYVQPSPTGKSMGSRSASGVSSLPLDIYASLLRAQV